MFGTQLEMEYTDMLQEELYDDPVCGIRYVQTCFIFGKAGLYMLSRLGCLLPINYVHF